MLQLHIQSSGAGEPLVILHGLFGMSDNWLSLSRRFPTGFQVIVPDLRNHGRSPHDARMDYSAMAEDVARIIQPFESANVLGHSMGGKVAMQLALSRPKLVKRLIVADIAPRNYPPHHGAILDAISQINLRQYSQRQDVDEALKTRIPESAPRQLLLKNLQRLEAAEGTGFRWKFNADAIIAHYATLSAAPPAQGQFNKPTLFVRGETSDYIREPDHASIRELFPGAEFATIPGAGHWLHADQPEQFHHVCEQFLTR